MSRRAVLALFALGLLAPGSGAALAQAPATVPAPPVKKVVLYKHGVGYFERRGKVDGNATLELSFKANQMKDMLKSLFALDLGGGRITTILYDSKDPLSKQLEGILIDVPEGNALTQLAQRLKGARVEAVLGTRSIRGSVLGIEPVVQRVDQSTVTTYKLLLVSDEDGVQPINLLDLSSLKLLDDPLQKDLKRVLDVYLKSKYADRKTVLLRAEGNGARDLRIGYIVETPIWKTSYRLLFEEGQPPYLQGWAIAENATDDDWSDVQISFVAGAPISFSMDLYTSYYPHRQTIGLPTLGASGYAAAALEETEKESADALAFGGADKPAENGPRRSGRAAAKAMRMLEAAAAPGQAAPAAPPPPMADLANASMQPMAQGVKVGDLFAYEGKGLVTIPRGKAALVPILGEKPEGTTRILYYKRELSTYPAHAAYFANATDLTLESGPITFFDGATCVGEGVLPKALQSGMHEIIPFALETGVTVEPATVNDRRQVSRAWIAHGILFASCEEFFVSTYKLANKTKKDYTLYIDHPKAGGDLKLVEPAKADEELPAHYRFKTEVKAGASVEFKARERHEVQDQIALLGTDEGTIRFYLQQRYLTERAKAFLREMTGLQAQVGAGRRDLEQWSNDLRKLDGDQDRVRKNVSILRDNAEELAKRQQFLKRLEENEAKIDALKAKIEETQGRVREIEGKLAQKVQEFAE